MEQLKPLTDFFEAIRKDGRIGSTHICIYAALLKIRADKGFSNPIKVYSREVMEIAKISWRNTFYTCVHDLSDYGYIRYHASNKKNEGSSIYFME